MNMPLGPDAIMEILPHRPPFLLIDEVTELEPGKKCVAFKYVKEDEPHFVGHFPGNPVMPGVLIVEGLAQAGAVAILALEQNKGKIPFFAAIDSIRFKRPVLPGDTLKLETIIERSKGPIGKGTATAYVDDQIVAAGMLTFALK